ncbi:MAG: hypothetical protein SGCHY_002571 [Lobulomycetales sp.]
MKFVILSAIALALCQAQRPLPQVPTGLSPRLTCILTCDRDLFSCGGSFAEVDAGRGILDGSQTTTGGGGCAARAAACKRACPADDSSAATSETSDTESDSTSGNRSSGSTTETSDTESDSTSGDGSSGSTTETSDTDSGGDAASSGIKTARAIVATLAAVLMMA